MTAMRMSFVSIGKYIYIYGAVHQEVTGCPAIVFSTISNAKVRKKTRIQKKSCKFALRKEEKNMYYIIAFITIVALELL